MFQRRNTDISKASTINIINLEGSDIFNAINSNDIQKIKLFLNNQNHKIWKVKDENGYTALHRLVFINNYELTLLLIKEVKKGIGLDPSNTLEKYINEETSEGYTALHYAAINGNLKIVKLLKEYGAKIECVTKLGKNVLHLAAESNQPSILVHFLLNEPLEITSVDENGSTPLHWACYSGAFESVNYLLSLDANINALDNEKFTPLHLAVTNNKEKIVRFLLQKGADKTISSIKKELPIDIARNKNYVNIENLLLDKGFNPLCTFEFPNTYIMPTDIYKKYILLMIIIPEILIFFGILSFIEEMYHTYVNLSTFFLCLLTFIIFIKINPGYQQNSNLMKKCRNEGIKNPLKILINEEVDLKKYCPICFVENEDNNKIKHCFLCNKCVLELKHHCFWINKCIGKKNKIVFLAFLLFSFFYSIYSIFICFNLLFDTVYTSYDKKFPPSWLTPEIERRYRVLFALIIIAFSTFISFPLFFLFMTEIFKAFKLLGNKKAINNFGENDNKITNNEDLIINNNERDKKIIEEENESIKIPNEDFPIVESVLSKKLIE
jgi:palmitoyltransferase